MQQCLSKHNTTLLQHCWGISCHHAQKLPTALHLAQSLRQEGTSPPHLTGDAGVVSCNSLLLDEFLETRQPTVCQRSSPNLPFFHRELFLPQLLQLGSWEQEKHWDRTQGAKVNKNLATHVDRQPLSAQRFYNPRGAIHFGISTVDYWKIHATPHAR